MYSLKVFFPFLFAINSFLNCEFCAFYGKKTKHKRQIPKKFEIPNFNKQNYILNI